MCIVPWFIIEYISEVKVEVVWFQYQWRSREEFNSLAPGNLNEILDI